MRVSPERRWDAAEGAGYHAVRNDSRFDAHEEARKARLELVKAMDQETTERKADNYKHAQVSSTLPPKQQRMHPISKYHKPNRNDAGYDWSIHNYTLDRFLQNDYTKRYVQKCNPDWDLFNEKFLVQITALDNGYNFLNDQINTLAFQPQPLCKVLLGALFDIQLDGEHAKSVHGIPIKKQYFSWKYIKRMVVVINEIKEKSMSNWEEHSNEKLLFIHFKHWYCINLLGSIFIYRAKLVEDEFGFSEIEAVSSNNRPHYPEGTINKVKNALDILHKFEKKLAENDKQKQLQEANEDSQSAELSTIKGRRKTRGQDNDDCKYEQTPPASRNAYYQSQTVLSAICEKGIEVKADAYNNYNTPNTNIAKPIYLAQPAPSIISLSDVPPIPETTTRQEAGSGPIRSMMDEFKRERDTSYSAQAVKRQTIRRDENVNVREASPAIQSSSDLNSARRNVKVTLPDSSDSSDDSDEESNSNINNHSSVKTKTSSDMMLGTEYQMVQND